MMKATRTFVPFAAVLALAMPASAQTAPAAQLPSITLDEALTRARANEPTFAAALAAGKIAILDKSIARSALLPQVVYHNQYLYTQANGAFNQAGSTGGQAAPKFIANNTVHEYASQAQVNETLGLAQTTAVSRASAEAAIASAELEIARRGLTATVVQLFYAVTAAEAKAAIEQTSLDEATNFVQQTQQREDAREAAHADVIKAQLTLQQRQRDVDDAHLAAEKARLDLGVLLFADPRSPYTVVTPTASALPTQSAVETAAAAGNPELKSALATLRSKDLGITEAKAAYLPDLGLNFTYGIDAQQFAIHGPDGVHNLGYSASATLDIPVWDWLATQHKVKQAQILRDAAKVQLSSTQRTLIAQLQEFYAEAALAQHQLDSLDLSVRTAEESLKLTRLRYTAGESSVLEVVDAQNTLTEARLAQTEGTMRYRLSLANLQLLTGTI
jgi:outer membrane protein TolC